MHVDVACAKRRSDFQTNEARADHDGAFGCLCVADQGITVGQGAKVVHMRQMGTGQVEVHRVGTGCQQQGVVAELAAVLEFDLARCRVNAADARIQLQLNLELFVEVGRVRWIEVSSAGTGEHAF